MAQVTLNFPSDIIGRRWARILTEVSPNGYFGTGVWLQSPGKDTQTLTAEIPIGAVIEWGITAYIGRDKVTAWRSYGQIHSDGVRILDKAQAVTIVRGGNIPPVPENPLTARVEWARGILENTQVLKVQAAARAVNFKFRNGLTKAEIINGLANRAELIIAAAEWVQNMPAPATPQPSIEALLEGEDSTPAPMPPEGPQTPPNAPIDLSGYITRPEHSAAISGLTATIDALTGKLETLKNERAQVIIQMPEKPAIKFNRDEHHFQFGKLITYLTANRKVMLTGSAGSGKSRAVVEAAAALGVDFHLQNPGSMGHELIGYMNPNGQFVETPVYRAFKNGGLCLLDEFDNWAPDALLVGNPIFDDNGFATFGNGEIVRKHPDCFLVFNANTTGHGATMQYTGRNRLDGATIDRPGLHIHWEIDPAIQKRMAGGFDDWLAAVLAVRRFMDSRGIVDVNATPRRIMAGAKILALGIIPRVEVIEDTLKTGALTEVWADVMRLPEVSTFIRGQ